jgi:hypothetical protein
VASFLKKYACVRAFAALCENPFWAVWALSGPRVRVAPMATPVPNNSIIIVVPSEGEPRCILVAQSLNAKTGDLLEKGFNRLDADKSPRTLSSCLGRFGSSRASANAFLTRQRPTLPPQAPTRRRHAATCCATPPWERIGTGYDRCYAPSAVERRRQAGPYPSSGTPPPRQATARP